ncbi:hypothetical protein BF49_1310 [Bradyrhizobium sp.]|nr:hypothetical protein BF49_1310 [Bradyrhizobium sp.]
MSETFRRRKDGEDWALDMERTSIARDHQNRRLLCRLERSATPPTYI